MVPLGASALDRRAWLGESDLSDARGVSESRLSGDLGRSGDREAPGASRSFDFPLPNPLNADPRFDEDFRSGDDARPYGWALCRLRPSTVQNRLSGFELCFSCTASR